MVIASVCAQDIIVTTDAQKIEAKILEVSKTEIKYKEKDNLDGPTFTLGVEDINSIIYANGKVTLFNDKQSAEKAEPESIVRKETEQKIIVDFEIERSGNQLMCRFINRSSGATDFRWDFGDGTFGFAKDETIHAYEKMGTYTVTLTANVGEQKYVQQKTLNLEEQLQEDQIDRILQQASENGEMLGQAIANLIESENSYALIIKNDTKHPYKINLDGHILGVVNPYKTERFIVPVEVYGRMQAVQSSGYMFSPTIKEYKISRQKKQTACSVVIK